MCKFGKNRIGPQGPTGPTGVASPTLSFNANTILIGAATNVSVFTSASTSGVLVFSGFINFQTTATPVTLILIPVIAGSQQSALTMIHTMPPAIGPTSSAMVPVSGFINILAGNSFAINVSASQYGLSDKVFLTVINYKIQ